MRTAGWKGEAALTRRGGGGANVPCEGGLVNGSRRGAGSRPPGNIRREGASGASVKGLCVEREEEVKHVTTWRVCHSRLEPPPEGPELISGPGTPGKDFTSFSIYSKAIYLGGIPNSLK